MMIIWWCWTRWCWWFETKTAMFESLVFPDCVKTICWSEKTAWVENGSLFRFWSRVKTFGEIHVADMGDLLGIPVTSSTQGLDGAGRVAVKYQHCRQLAELLNIQFTLSGAWNTAMVMAAQPLLGATWNLMGVPPWALHLRRGGLGSRHRGAGIEVGRIG